ncbi:hypothetical protein D1007_01510 [Hordeum vulgare]|nr:hypothetical protein D1007_01510 [Hordeum vulgare]
MEFGVHHVDTHLSKTDLTMVYTVDPAVVENSINTMQLLLAADDKYKVVGFDLAYTGGRAGHDEKVVLPSCACAIMPSFITTAWPQSLASVSRDDEGSSRKHSDGGKRRNKKMI